MMLQDRFDRIVFSLGILLFVGGILLVNFFEMKPSSNLDNLVPIAQVTKIEKSSKRKLVGSLSWDNVSIDADLYQGDLVLTGINEGIDIAYKNNLQITIGENSLVKIDLKDNVFDLEVIKGSLDVNMAEAGGKLTVRSGDSVKVLEGKSAKINVSADGVGITTLVKKGNVSTLDKGRTTTPKPIVKAPVKRPLFSLSKSNFNPSKDSVVKINNLTKDNISLQFSKNRSFDQSSTIDISANGGSMAMPSPGTYYLKDKNGVIKDFNVDVFTPPLLKEVKSVYDVIPGEMIPLRVDGNSLLEYKVVISGAFEKELLLKGSSLNIPAIAKGRVDLSIAPVNDLEAVSKIFFDINFISPIELDYVRVSHQLSQGEYRYAQVTVTGKSKEDDFRKVIAIETESGRVISPNQVTKTKAQFQNIKIGEYKVIAKSIKGNIPLKKFSVQRKISARLKEYQREQIATSLEKITGKIFWSDMKIDKYRLLVARDSNFEKILVDEKVVLNRYSFMAPKVGAYYWKVEAVDNKNILSSNTQLLNISYPEVIKITDAKKVILKNTKSKGVTCYEFELPEYKKVLSYQLEVYSDKELGNLVFQRKMTKNKGCWYSNKTGRFYYRYRVKDMWSRLSNYSPLGEMIFPISPLTEF